MRTFEHRGTTLAYRYEGSGPAIAFLHNGGTSSTIWRHQVEALRDRYTTIAVDLPGFGASPRPDHPVDLADQVDAIAALLRAERATPALLVGNCMGSNIAAGLAQAHPDLVVGLVLVNPLTEATFSGGGLGLLHRMRRWAPRTTRAMRSLSRRIVPPRLVAQATLWYQVGRRGAARGVHRDAELVACSTRRDQLPALVDVLDDMPAYGALDRGGPLGVPVRTVWGRQNRVLSYGAGRELDAVLAPDCADVVEGCGHLVMLEAPEEITAIIADEAEQRLGALATDRGGVR